MKDEIKEILDKLKSNNYPFGIATIDIDKLLDYITSLREENKRLKEDMKIKDNIISITYNKDTKEYILDRKNYYKINKRLYERLDYKSRCEKAIYYIWKEIEQEYDEENNKWLKEKIDNLLNILNGGDEE